MTTGASIKIRDTSSAEDLSSLRRDYLDGLAAPMDGMWETFAELGRHLEIHIDGDCAGFVSVNEAGRLLQFHIARPFTDRAREAFAALIDRDDVAAAIVSTADRLLLNLCLDLERPLEVHTYLYQDRGPAQSPFDATGDMSFDLVDRSQLTTIAELQRASLDPDPGEWLLGYLENLITRGELYALRHGEEIVGTGEARVSDSQPPHVDLGVITFRDHRGRGVAPHILGRLKHLCYERGLVPICSTTVDNAASRRAIGKAGFVSQHRLLELRF